MNRIEGYLQSNSAGAKLIADALKEGPIMFSWTYGATHYDFYMIPSTSFKTAWFAPDKTQRWCEHGQVIVGIERKGCFNFGLLDGQEFYEGYVAEKLGLDPRQSDASGVAELFNLIVLAGQPDRRITLP